MSLSTLEILNNQKANQVRLCPSSESFTISGVDGPLYGIFDDSPAEDSKDPGNVKPKRQVPRFMMTSIPDSVSIGATVTRANGTVYRVQRLGEDTEGLVPLWLY